VARRLEINVGLPYRWREEFRKNPTRAFARWGNKIVAGSRQADLERKIGQMTMEIDEFPVGPEILHIPQDPALSHLNLNSPATG